MLPSGSCYLCEPSGILQTRRLALFHTLHRPTATSHTCRKPSQREASRLTADGLQTTSHTRGGRSEASQRQFHRRQSLARHGNDLQRDDHAVLRDAIHVATSIGSYRTDRPTRTDGSSPAFVKLHNVRSEIRSTSAASLTVINGVSVVGGSFVVIMGRASLQAANRAEVIRITSTRSELPW